MDATTRPARPWGVWVGMGLIVLGALVGVIILLRLQAIDPITTQFGFPGFQLPISIVFGTAGAVILRRRPGNVIGGLLLAEGVLSALQFPIESLPRVLHANGVPTGGIEWTYIVANVAWVPAVGVFGLLFALYPDGRPVSRGWGRVVPAIWVGAAATMVGLTLTPGPFYNYPDVTNPLGLPILAGSAMTSVWYLLFLAPVALAGASLLVRWRRSTGDAREQLKWLAFVAVPFAIAGFLATLYPVASLVMIGLGALVPVAIAIAILRYRLYDIDELVSRTVVFGALTAILAGVYTAALKFFNELFLQITGTESEGAIILATLVLAAAFTPVRKSLEGVAERRLKPRPAAATSPAAGGSLVSPGVDVAVLEDVVRRAIREELRAAASPPTEGSSVARSPVDDPATQAAAAPFAAVPVEDPAQA